MTGTNSRVEIDNQFNIDHVSCNKGGPITVDRQPTNLATSSIRNWNQLCDSIDAELLQLNGPRRTLKIVSISFYIAILVYGLGVHLLPTLLPSKIDLVQYSPALIYPIILVYIFIWCKMIKRCTDVMDKVQEVCQQHSTNGVRYTLESEHWGGCNKVRTSMNNYL